MVPHTHAILKRKLRCQPLIDAIHTVIAGNHSFAQGEFFAGHSVKFSYGCAQGDFLDGSEDCTMSGDPAFHDCRYRRLSDRKFGKPELPRSGGLDAGRDSNYGNAGGADIQQLTPKRGGNE